MMAEKVGTRGDPLLHRCRCIGTPTVRVPLFTCSHSSACHGIRKRGVVVERPALEIVLRCYRKHYANALDPADGSERAAAIDARQFTLPQYNNVSLERVVGLDLAADDVVPARSSPSFRNFFF